MEGGEAISWWVQLVVNVPIAGAVIYTARLFLDHIKGDRESRDQVTNKFLEVLDSQKVAMTELTVEVKQQNLLLRGLTGADLGQD